jgi:hypothetical protein
MQQIFGVQLTVTDMSAVQSNEAMVQVVLLFC